MAHLLAWKKDGSDRAVMQRMASGAFFLRVINAGIAFLSQILLARWMGGYEYGIYIYVWTWLLLLGGIAGVGLSSAAPRFVPEYSEHNDLDGLRGFLRGGPAVAVFTSLLFVGAGAGLIYVLGDNIPQDQVFPLYLGLLCLPMFVLTEVQDGIARSYNWVNIALGPAYLVRPLLVLGCIGVIHFLGLPSTASWLLIGSLLVVCITAIGQSVILNRNLAARVPKGPVRYDVGKWIAISLPILLVDGFYLLLTYCDILILNFFVTPDEVAIYSVATKIMSLVAFVFFAVSAAATHRFTEYAARGDKTQLALLIRKTVKWTFWPSLLMTLALLAVGHYLLLMFGESFTKGYYLLPVLAIGLLARASIGPIERMLSMLGEQKISATIYAICFGVNVTLDLILIPYLGLLGAAIGTTLALCVETILLFWTLKKRLGINVFKVDIPSVSRFESVDGVHGVVVETVSSSAIENFAQEWKQLSGRAVEPNVYYDPDFALPLLRHLPEYKNIHFYAVWREQPEGNRQLVALMAAKACTYRWGIPIKALAGWQPYAPLGTPLLDQEHGVEAAKALLAFLSHYAGFWHIPFMTHNGEAARLLKEALHQRGQSVDAFDLHQRAVLTTDPDVSFKKRRNLLRLRRLLAQKGAVSFQISQTPQEHLQALDIFLNMEAKGWKKQKGALLSRNALESFIRETMTTLGNQEQGGVVVLRCNDVPVAAGIVLRSGDRGWYFKTAYDEQWAHYSPGAQLSLALTRWFREKAALTLMDSTAVANHPMIDLLWPERQDMAHWLILLAPEKQFLRHLVVRLELWRTKVIQRLGSLRRSVMGRRK